MKKKSKKPAAKKTPRVNWRAPRDPKPSEEIVVHLPFTTSKERARQIASAQLSRRTKKS